MVCWIGYSLVSISAGGIDSTALRPSRGDLWLMGDDPCRDVAHGGLVDPGRPDLPSHCGRSKREARKSLRINPVVNWTGRTSNRVNTEGDLNVPIGFAYRTLRFLHLARFAENLVELSAELRWWVGGG